MIISCSLVYSALQVFMRQCTAGSMHSLTNVFLCVCLFVCARIVDVLCIVGSVPLYFYQCDLR